MCPHTVIMRSPIGRYCFVCKAVGVVSKSQNAAPPKPISRPAKCDSDKAKKEATNG